jgi:hypothetical protein
MTSFIKHESTLKTKRNVYLQLNLGFQFGRFNEVIDNDIAASQRGFARGTTVAKICGQT